MTSADWTPVFVLPNIPLDTAIGCEIAALAPANDRRVAALKRAHPTLRRFLNRFADNFGQKFEPSVLILGATAPPIFRDLTAYVIHRMLTEGAVRASDKRAQFIGFGPYVAASGTMLRDLFQGDDGGWLQDVRLVDQMVADKLKAESDAIVAEGWKWIGVAPDFAYGHATRRLHPPGRCHESFVGCADASPDPELPAPGRRMK